MTQTTRTDLAPAPVGAYSQAAGTDDLLFTAGQVPETDDGEVLHDASIEEQTRQCLDNLAGILSAEGASASDIIKTTVYLVGIDHWEQVDGVYEDNFEHNPPARSVVGVTGLWGDVDVEIEAVIDVSH